MKDTNLAFLTGGSGFVGSAVARELLTSGFKIRALIRKKSPTKNIEGLSLDIVEGDLSDFESISRAMQGSEYVFHVAADYRLWSPDPKDIIQNNVYGTQNVMMSALESGVKKIVYTSSVATLRIKNNKSINDEKEILDVKDAIGAYKKSKVLAEEIVLKLQQTKGLPVIIVNPSTPVGPRDIRPTPTGRIIVEAARGRIPAYVDTGLNIVHVDDVTHGHLLAFKNGRIGERYILGGENMTLAEMLKTISRMTGGRNPFVRLPRHLVYPFAYVSQIKARFTGKDPFATIDGLRMAKKHMFFSSGKAEQELGYKPRSAFLAIQDALEWFDNEGYI